MATSDEENYIRKFLQNIDCLDKLSPWIENFNLFDFIKRARNIFGITLNLKLGNTGIIINQRVKIFNLSDD